MLTPEEWRPVSGYEGYYEVSSSGRVRSVARTVSQKGGTWRYKSYTLRQDISASGYPRVTLSRGNKPRTYQVHRLVAEAFIQNPENFPMVLHWNDVKTDNRHSNLRWGTNRDNQLDSVRNETNPRTRRTHCLAGHPYDSENTYRGTSGIGARKCRRCHAEKERERRKRRRIAPRKEYSWNDEILRGSLHE